MQDFTKLLEEMVGHALEAAALVAVDEIVKITPRDKNRPPKSINRKDGKRPKRKNGVTSLGGNYYPQVTGNLKKSIGYEKESNTRVKIGAEGSGPASQYAAAQEFGSPKKNLPPRPYISIVQTDTRVQEKVLKEFERACKIFLARQ